LEIGEIKTELADVYLYSDDPYEAILLYSQVIDANRNNNLGDEVKLKKAQLGYYMGNFSWAKAQLDVLKASTSKLTANDAMELALFISNNSSQDSIDKALEYFARADLLFFRNKNKEAMATLDTIDKLFPYHSLVDDVLYRKAKIHLASNEPQFAAELLERVAREFSFDLLADDALYLLGDTYNYRLNDQKKAAETYRRILFEHPGSIYVPQAREKFRQLNVLPPELDKDDEHFKEDLHLRKLIP
jgi:tetratricopeptide (TPR) repeat protein